MIEVTDSGGLRYRQSFTITMVSKPVPVAASVASSEASEESAASAASSEASEEPASTPGSQDDYVPPDDGGDD